MCSIVDLLCLVTRVIDWNSINAGAHWVSLKMSLMVAVKNATRVVIGTAQRQEIVTVLSATLKIRWKKMGFADVRLDMGIMTQKITSVSNARGTAKFVIRISQIYAPSVICFIYSIQKPKNVSAVQMTVDLHN